MPTVKTTIFGKTVNVEHTDCSTVREFLLETYVSIFDGDVELATSRMNRALELGTIEIHSEDVAYCEEDRGEGYVDVRYSILR